MQVSVETLKGLERKVTVSVPTAEFEKEVNQRLKELSRTAKINGGFRPGSAQLLKVITDRYSSGVRSEVAQKFVQSTLSEALKAHELNPAGYPSIVPETVTEGKDFTYTATFEVFPSFEIQELQQEEIELIKAEVSDNDVKEMLNKLREQNKTWHEVDRKVKKGDKVIIDYEGFEDGKPFAGGSAKNQELIIGQEKMIPGFEKAIIGAKLAKPFEFKISFPKDYGHKEMAGKEVSFKVIVHKILEGKLADDETFVEKFKIKGGLEALTKDVKENMIRELNRVVDFKNRETLLAALMKINAFDLPEALVEKEIENLKHELYHRIYGHKHQDNEKIPDYPREMFTEEAKRRVHLGLLFAEYVKKHQLSPEKERVEAMIDKLASAYEVPAEVKSLYNNSKKHMAEIESLVIEELVAEKIALTAKLSYKEMDYDTVMNPPKVGKDKGE